MSIDKFVEIKLSDTVDQAFDEELADFDAVTPAWDGEVNAVAGFDSVTDADGDLNDHADAAHDGDVGLEITFDDATAAYGVKNADAVNQTSFVISFWFNKNDVAIEAAKFINLVITSDGTPAVQNVVRYYAADTISFITFDDAAAAQIIPSGALGAGWHKITAMWKRSTGAGNDDGWMRMYIDDVLVGELTGLDDDTRDWDYTRAGLLYTNSTTFGGSYYMDTIKVDPVGAPMVDTLAAQSGTYGLSIPVMDTTARKGIFTGPTAEKAITQECWFDPNSLSMAEGDSFVFMSAVADVDFRVCLKYTSGVYTVALNVTDDADVDHSTSYYSITDGWNHIKVYWRASTGAGDDNGYGALYIGHDLQEELTGIDNDAVSVSYLYFGAVYGLDAGTYGIMYFDDCKWGPWADITADVMGNKPYSHSQGIGGNKPTSLVASPGKFTFCLNNSSKNSLGKAGCYSPGHSNLLTGFKYGAPIRIRYDDVDFWRGTICDIFPDPSPYKAFTKVIAYDWMKEAETQKFKETAVATDQRGDQALTTLVDLVPTIKQPASRGFDVGKSTLPYVFHSERDEKSTVMSICQKIAQSELGKIYINHQDGDGEQLVFENRHHSVSETTVQHDFDDDVVQVTPSYPSDLIKTKVITTARPSRIDTGDVVFSQLQKSFQVPAGETRSPTLFFRDPDGDSRISASSLAVRVSGTDYIANANEDGSGGDRTSDLTVTVNAVSGNSITLDCENTSGTAFWVTTLQQKGKGIYQFDPLTYEAVASAAVIAEKGERVLRYDLPYEDSYNQAVASGDYLLNIWKDPICQITGLTYYPEESSTLTTAFLAIDIGHRITVNFTQLGIDQDYFVAKISVSLDRGFLKCSYNLHPAGSSAFMQLNDPIYAKLNADECRLAF